MPRFPGRHPVEVEFDPQSPLGGHLRAAAGEASGPHVLGRQHIPTLEGLQAGLDQALLQERIPHLHSGTVIEGGLGEFGAGETGPPHAVPAGGAAHIDHRIPGTDGAGADDVVGFHQPQGHGVHQRVAAVAGVERHLTAHGGHADAVAVVGDAGHHPLHQGGVAGILEGPEAQGIEQGDRPRPHGEDVPQDASHPGGRPLEGFHRRGVVVALDLEGQSLPLPQIHHPGVFPGSHQDAGAAGGELAQQGTGVAVATVLRPHHPEHAQFGPIGVPPQPAPDLLVVRLAEPLLAKGIGQRKRGGHHQSRSA
jgi:hypothetical protein